MNYLAEIKQRSAKEVDFGPGGGEFALSNTEFLYAWHDLAEAYGLYVSGENKQLFARKFTWWGGLISYLRAEIATAETEWAADVDGEWHFRELEDYTDHWRVQLKAAEQIQYDLDGKLVRLYGN